MPYEYDMPSDACRDERSTKEFESNGLRILKRRGYDGTLDVNIGDDGRKYMIYNGDGPLDEKTLSDLRSMKTSPAPSKRRIARSKHGQVYHYLGKEKQPDGSYVLNVSRMEKGQQKILGIKVPEIRNKGRSLRKGQTTLIVSGTEKGKRTDFQECEPREISGVGKNLGSFIVYKKQ